MTLLICSYAIPQFVKKMRITRRIMATEDKPGSVHEESDA